MHSAAYESRLYFWILQILWEAPVISACVTWSLNLSVQDTNIVICVQKWRQMLLQACFGSRRFACNTVHGLQEARCEFT
jgi:hypothetical protein